MTMWERLAMDAIVDCIIREIFPEEARDMCLILKWWLISLILSKPFPGVRGKNGVRFREILAMPFLLITCLKKWLKIQCFICHIKISSWEKSHKKSCNYITEREKFGKLECFRRSNGERDSVHERGKQTNKQKQITKEKLKGEKWQSPAKLSMLERFVRTLCFWLRGGSWPLYRIIWSSDGKISHSTLRCSQHQREEESNLNPGSEVILLPCAL